MHTELCIDDYDGGLLEETIMSIKEKDDEIEALRDNPNSSRGLWECLEVCP